MTIADIAFWRDIVIIVSGVLASVLFFLAIVFTVIVGVATRSLIGTIQTLLRAEVTPLLQTARQTAKQVRGTAAFVSETAVTPVIRVYSVVVGVRRVAGVLSGVSGRGRRRRSDK